MIERILRQITDHFVAKLPNGASYYHIEDLKKQDFPDFLVQRIHIELQWNLDESMILPETDWANTKSEAVQRSWHQFLKAIHAEAKLPASYAKAVIETAVADIVEMLVEPRKKITDILFGGEKVLKAADLNERAQLLVVYPHFAKVLTGYMQRKTRDEMSRSRCKKIVAQVDDKVTRQYTPLQWAQMLDPLFTLGDSRVDSNLLRLFYEDRQMHRTAGKFDAMDETITRAEFVEVLSEPELWDHEDYEEEQSKNSEREEQKPIDLKKHADLDDIGLVYENIGEIHKDNPSSGKSVPEAKKVRKPEQKREQEVNRRKEKAWEVNMDTDADMDDDFEPEDPAKHELEEFQSAFKEREEDEKPESNDSMPDFKNQAKNEEESEMGPELEEHKTVAKGQDEDDENPEAEPEKKQQEEEEPYSLNAFFAESDDDEEEADDQRDMLYSPFAMDDEIEETNIVDEEEGAAQPIWMRYRKEHDTEEESDEEIMPRFVEIEDEQGRWSKSLADKSYEEEAADTDYQLEDLRTCLKKERGYFIDELFNGSEPAYKESLEKIAEENSWKDASRLIEQDIFRRNNVNIFSAAAVNFIDRLQNFFLEKHNRN